MSGVGVALLLAAVVGGMVVQSLLAVRQARAFTRATAALRRNGTVAVGAGGRRYRGGRAFVALSADATGTVTDALVLRGMTTFARPAALPAVLGRPLSRLTGEAQLPGLRPSERDAVRQAAATLRSSLTAARR